MQMGFEFFFLANDPIKRYKARLVVKGLNQKDGINYHETFNLIIKMKTIRFLLSIDSSKNCYLHHFDINTLFLHGDLDGEVYMKCPPRLNVSNNNLVFKLNKSIYTLKQTSRQWNNKLTSTLFELGFHSPNQITPSSQRKKMILLSF